SRGRRRSVHDGLRTARRVENLRDQTIELRLCDVEGPGNGGAALDFHRDDHATVGGLDNPAEPAQVHLARLVAFGAGILDAIDGQEHRLQYAFNVELRPQGRVVAIVVHVLGDRVITLAEDDFNVVK